MPDCWAEWLLRRRFGGETTPDWIVDLERVRDRVLDGAEVGDGDIVLDVGTGDGLIAFGALERGASEVIFSDVSQDLLEVARGLAGCDARCRFVLAAAEDLGAIADGSVDVVTTRSVLIFVKDKARAFAEFQRVLRPGGRISLFEPINRFGMEQRLCGWGYEAGDAQPLFDRVNAVFDAIQPPDDPMLDFDERDLIALAERSGFYPLELTLEAEIRPSQPMSWERWANTAGNPRIPTFAEAAAEVLTPAEAEVLERVLRPQVEQGLGTWRMAKAYLRAAKRASGSDR